MFCSSLMCYLVIKRESSSSHASKISGSTSECLLSSASSGTRQTPGMASSF